MCPLGGGSELAMVSRASRLVLVLVFIAALPALVHGQSSSESDSWFVAIAGAMDAEPPATGPAPTPAPPPTAAQERDREKPRPRAFNEMIDNVVVSARKRQESLQ